jgi:flagellar basal-body rod protein FlgB
MEGFNNVGFSEISRSSAFVPDQLGSMLDAIGMRQRIISHNVANVETPGYEAQEMDFKSVLQRVNNPSETSLARKMGRSTMDSEITSSGKPVDVTHEFLAMQENQLAYSMAVRRITTVFSNLKTAAQVGR